MNFLNKIIHKVDGEITSLVGTFKGQKRAIQQNVVEIIPRLYYFPFPKFDQMTLYGEYFNQMFGQTYFVWNLSEHTYDSKYFNDQVSENCAIGYPNPTIDQLFLIAKDIISFLNSSMDHIALVHCQSSKGRSALLLSCLLCLVKKYEHPLDAFTYFCEKIHQIEAQVLFASQKLYLIYFQNIINGMKAFNYLLNDKPIRILKITMNEIPQIYLASGQSPLFCPYIQIFKESNIIYNSLSPKQRPKEFLKADNSCQFEVKIDAYNDLLIRCKHFLSNNERLPVFRVMFNTKFIFDSVIRFSKNELDFSEFVHVSDKFFIEILTEEAQETVEEQKLRKGRDNLDYIVKFCQQKVSLLQNSNEQENHGEKYKGNTEETQESFAFQLADESEEPNSERKKSENTEIQETNEMMQQLVERQEEKMKKKQEQKEKVVSELQQEQKEEKKLQEVNEQELIRQQLEQEISQELLEHHNIEGEQPHALNLFEKEKKEQADDEDIDEYMKKLEEQS